MDSVPSSAALMVAGVILSLAVLSFGIMIINNNQGEGVSYTQTVDSTNETLSDISDYTKYNAKNVPGYEVINCIKLLSGNEKAIVNGTWYSAPASDADVDCMYQKTNAKYIDQNATYSCYVHYKSNGSVDYFEFVLT